VDEGKGTGSGGSEETGKVKGKENSVNSPSDGKPKPKINPDSTPGGQGDKDVERHNKEMEERYDKKGKNDVDEKAGKGYWQGELLFVFGSCEVNIGSRMSAQQVWED